MSTITLKAPSGVSTVSVGGANYAVSSSGLVTIPAQYVSELLDSGFTTTATISEITGLSAQLDGIESDIESIQGDVSTLQSDLTEGLAGKQDALSNASTLVKITESSGEPLWNGAAWPGSGGGSYTEVANYAALPEPALHDGAIYAVLAPQGTYFVNRKPAGYYLSNGAAWSYLADLGDPYFSDGALAFSDDADSTKILHFQLSGISHATTVTAAWPDKSGTVALTSDLGTAAAKNIPATGDASVTEVVYGTDTRLTDARTPTSHSHAISDVTSLSTALSGKQATITTGTTAQYFKGDLSLGTMDASAVGLGSVENTALSTWGGSSNLTTLGTIGTGVWHGTAIGDTYISSASTWSGKQDALTNASTLAKITESGGNPLWNGSAWPGGAGGGGLTRVAVNDADKSGIGTDGTIIAYTAISQTRTITLPAATTAGQQIIVMDESGSCSATVLLTINRAGSDTIDGQTSISLGTPYGSIWLVADGTSKWTIRRTKFRQLTITGNGSWVAPAGCFYVHLLMCGGGGGGCYATSTNAGNGGGGGMIVNGFYPVTPGTSYSITIGAAGTAGTGSTNGGNGGATSFGSVVSAPGGGGGANTDTIVTGTYYLAGPGVYGNPTWMTVFFNSGWSGPMTIAAGCGGICGHASTAQVGQAGGAMIGAGGTGGTTANTLPGGGGGGGSYGAGGNAGNGATGGNVGTAAAANTGGGGGGAGAGASKNGGEGGTGICIITWLE